MRQVSSTHLQEVRRASIVNRYSVAGFQSTHLQEVRRQLNTYPNHCLVFQSTHLQEVRRFGFCLFGKVLCFNPRTYKRCDNGSNIKNQRFTVSIHAPTRGATWCNSYQFTQNWFQSTHLQEVRHIFHYQGARLFQVSIHAPTRGATLH